MVPDPLAIGPQPKNSFVIRGFTESPSNTIQYAENFFDESEIDGGLVFINIYEL